MKLELCRNVPLSPDTTQSVVHKLEIALTHQGLVRSGNALGPTTLTQGIWGSSVSHHAEVLGNEHNNTETLGANYRVPFIL